MGKFTYEEKDRKEQYETYEWDNVWIDHADDVSLKRVLYIGDSISCATRHHATERTENKILFDGFGTSKALDNPYFKDALKLFAEQESRRDVIIINNGLHGWHLEDEEEYGYHYEEMIKFLLKEYENTPLFIVLTTHISDAQRDKRVVIRNKTAEKIAAKYELPTIDLYTPTLEEELLSADGVHLTVEGYKLIAGKIIESISKFFPDVKIENL